MNIIARDIFNQLLGNGRTADIGIIDVNEHIYESVEGSSIIDTIVRVKAFIFGRYKRILDVLRNLVDGNGDSFGMVVDLIKAHQLSVGIVCIDIGIIFHFQFLDGNIGNFISETHNIDGHARCHNRSGDDTNQEQGNQCGAEN